MYLCLIAISLFGAEIFAQDVKVNFSPAAKLKDGVVSLHKNGTNLYSYRTIAPRMQFGYSATLKKVKYGLELTKYDSELKTIKTVSLDSGLKDYGPFQPQVYYGKNAIYALYYKFRNDEKITLYVAKVNYEDLIVTGINELFQYDQKNQSVMAGYKTIEETQTLLTSSADGKNTWVAQVGPEKILSCVIDDNLNIIQKSTTTETKLEDLSVSSAIIANDGTKVLSYRYHDAAVKEFYVRGVFIEPANGKATLKPIKYSNKNHPGNLSLLSSKDGKKVFIGGEYFDDDHMAGGKGVSLGEIDIATQKISSSKFFPYTADFKNRVLALDFGSKRKGEIAMVDRFLDYQLNELGNGTIILTSDMRSNPTPSRLSFAFRGPIVNVFIQPGGSYTINLIPKKQAGGSETDFFTFTMKDKFVCIYADHPKFQAGELEDKEIGLVRTVGAMIPVANIYDSNGNLLSRKKLINDSKQADGNAMISNYSKLENNKYLIPFGRTNVNKVFATAVDKVCYLEIL